MSAAVERSLEIDIVIEFRRTTGATAYSDWCSFRMPLTGDIPCVRSAGQPLLHQVTSRAQYSASACVSVRDWALGRLSRQRDVLLGSGRVAGEAGNPSLWKINDLPAASCRTGTFWR